MNNETRHRQIEQFVGREVFHCVSQLVTELTSKAEHFPEYEEDLYGAWHSPLTEEDCRNAYTARSGRLLREELFTSGMPDDCDTWQEACAMYDVDPSDYQRKVLEHWIVSDWLANRLEEHGELVLRDFFGLTVWGRTCSDQAISLDGVIGQIFDELQEAAA